MRISEKDLKDKGIVLKFGTPYAHTPIGSVESHIRTLPNYVRPFLLEGTPLKFALRRAIKTLRFTWNQSLNTTPFQMLTGQKPRKVLDRFFDLEHPVRTLTLVVKDVSGKVIESDSRVPAEIEQYESSR